MVFSLQSPKHQRSGQGARLSNNKPVTFAAQAERTYSHWRFPRRRCYSTGACRPTYDASTCLTGTLSTPVRNNKPARDVGAFRFTGATMLFARSPAKHQQVRHFDLSLSSASPCPYPRGIQGPTGFRQVLSLLEAPCAQVVNCRPGKPEDAKEPHDTPAFENLRTRRERASHGYDKPPPSTPDEE